MNERSVQTYPVVLAVATVGASPRDWVRESGVGEGIVLREMMDGNDDALMEVVRREDLAKRLMVEVNLRNLGIQ